MSDSQAVRIYTNDLSVERALQAKAAAGNRLQVLRNRVARGKTLRRLAALVIVAKERGDGTIEKEARERLVSLGLIEKGVKITDVITIVESRRTSKSKTAQALGLVAESTEAPVETA